MLPRFSGQFTESFLSKSKAWFVSLTLTSVILNSCSNITLQPKDKELVDLENFAKKVTIELFELNPSTYSEHQKSLEKEIAPDALAKLKAKGIYADSKDKMRQNIKAMNINHKRCLISIHSADFPSQATSQGLVPIEVKGTCVRSINDISKASEFNVLYLVGTRAGSKDPIMASVEIKIFD